MSNVHIFMDNSNVFGGAQNAAQSREKAPWQAVRIDYDNLFRLLIHKKSRRKTSMLAGSVPPGNEALWEAARRAGFDTTLLRRVETDTGRLIEQGVDEVIHLRIANVLLDEPEPGLMVIATGDGKTTEQGSSFTQQVVRAVRLGWKVEIWSWKDQLSKKLRDAGIANPTSVKVLHLDHWYHSLTFLKAGEWYVGDGNGNSRLVSVEGRHTAGLDLTEEKLQVCGLLWATA